MDTVDCECGKQAEFMTDDSRSEWYEAHYMCDCGKEYTRRQEYSQNGLVESDEITLDR